MHLTGISDGLWSPLTCTTSSETDLHM